MITRANTDPVSARTGIRERSSELPPRCAEGGAGAAVEEGEGDGVGAEASGATEPDALTLPITPCHTTVLASFFVDDEGVEISPPSEASTTTES